jgi:hypothetical protein
MEIELFFADQLVPTGELFRAMQKGTIDAVQSDDDSMAVADRSDRVRRLLPVRLALFADVPVLFNQYGLKEIWEAEYSAVGVKHISAGPGTRATSPPRTRSTRWPTSRASASSPSRPPAASWTSSAWCR